MNENEIITLIKNNDPETGMKILEKYGNDSKKSGAKSFAKLIQDMRRKQVDYDRSQNASTMKEMKHLETRVDLSVKVVLGVK